MSKLRIEKLQELMKQEISKIILTDLKDPAIGFVTVTNVELTNDLRHAKIWFSLFGEAEKQKETLLALERSLGFIRSELSKRIRLKFMPELHLQTDKSLDYSDHIQKLLLKIKEDEAN